MTREFLSLDFYGGYLVAALAVWDEQTQSLRLRHGVNQYSPSFCGALVRDMDGARRELTTVFEEISDYASGQPEVIIGLRGHFLSFKRASGFESISTRNRIIGQHEIQAALNNSVPSRLNPALEVVDILPQSYTIDGNTGIINPRGMAGFTLEAETFLSLALTTHLHTLTRVLNDCGCNEYQVLPSVIAQGETLLGENEKQAGALLLDIGPATSSAVMYYQGALVEAWEISFGQNRLVQALADLLQNDESSAREELKKYEPGSDEMIDEILEEAANGLVTALKKEFLQSLLFIQHPPYHLVLCGTAADKNLLKTCKKVLNVRKARLSAVDDLWADTNAADSPAYDGALALVSHTLLREHDTWGSVAKPTGVLSGLLTKLGLNELF